MIIFKEIDKFELGDCGADGAMGSSLTDYKSKLAKGLNFENNLPGIIEEKCDGDDLAIVAIAAPGEARYATGLLKKYTIDDMATFLGGTASGGPPTDTYTEPTERQTLNKSVKITGKAVSGKYGVYSMPKCILVAVPVGNPNSDAEGLLGIAFGFKQMIPTDASGTKLAPGTFVETAVA